ncbi:MAG: alpha/beta hydrolase [Chromatiaceae bacterium]|nr:alpha/beta hydrolase [Candidatus Thioaporhodococcus sediminis]
MNTAFPVSLPSHSPKAIWRSSLPEAISAPRLTLVSPSAGRLSYYADTRAAGRPLVLVHSINAAPSAFEMKPLFDRFRDRRPVFAPELPGFGFSDRGDRPYSPDLFANAIQDFLAQVVGEPADLVAFSLSAEFAARASLASPASIRSLVFLSPTGFSKRSLPTGDLSRRVHRALSLPGLSQGLFRLLTSKPSIRYFLGQAFVGETPAEMVEYAYATAHQPGARYAPLYFLSGQLFTPQAVEQLYARLQVPVLALYDRDPNITFDLLPDLVASHGNWRAERIAPTQGIPHWEKTAETAAAMDAFWTRLDQTRS